MNTVLRHLRHLPDGGNRSHAAQPVGLGLVVVRVLQREEHQPVAGQRAVHRFDRHGPIDRQRLEGERKHDRMAQCEHRELAGVGAFGFNRHWSKQ